MKIVSVMTLRRFINAPNEEYVRVKLFSALKGILFTYGLFQNKFELEKYQREEYLPPLHLKKQQELRERFKSDDHAYYLIILALGVICCEHSIITKKKVDDLVKSIYLLPNKEESTWLIFTGRDFLFFSKSKNG